MSSALKAVYRVRNNERKVSYVGVRIIHYIQEFKAVTDLLKRFYGVYIQEDKVWFFREEDFELLKGEIAIEDNGKYGVLKVDIDFGIGILEKSRESRKLKESRVCLKELTGSREEIKAELKAMLAKRRAKQII